MSCHEWDARLNDWVDGTLSDADRPEVEAHLETCPDCRRALEQIRGLVRAAAELPRGIRPRRDLLTGIREGLLGAEVVPARPVPWARWGAVAASLVLVSVAAITAIRLSDRTRDRATGHVLPASATNADPLEAAEQGYVEAARLLLLAIDERGDQLSPDARAELDRNLEIIDRAIAEIHAAIEVDPTNPATESHLTAVHQQKVELLRRFARLSS